MLNGRPSVISRLLNQQLVQFSATAFHNEIHRGITVLLKKLEACVIYFVILLVVNHAVANWK